MGRKSIKNIRQKEIISAFYKIAKKEGLEPVFVSPEETDPKIFDGVVLWMQPGGQSSTAAKAMAMTKLQIKRIKRFIGLTFMCLLLL